MGLGRRSERRMLQGYHYSLVFDVSFVSTITYQVTKSSWERCTCRSVALEDYLATDNGHWRLVPWCRRP